MTKTKRSKVKRKPKEEEEDEDLFLIRFMSEKPAGMIFYKILLFIPIPFLLWIMDFVFKKKIKIWMAYKEARKIEDATHILLYSTVEKEISILQIGKERLYLGNKAERDFLTIHFNNQRFVYDTENKTFISLHKTFVKTHIEKFVKKYRYGLKEVDSKKLRKTWGGNSLALDYMNITDIMVDSITHPFGVWEVFGLLVCIYDMGMFCPYTLCCWYFFIRGMISAVQDTLEVQAKMRDIAESNSSVIVVRENSDRTFTKKIVEVDALLPGDLIEVIANLPVPADCVLVNGECVMQESMLTGESTPVLKASYQLDDSDDRALPLGKITPKNILFAGSTTMYTKGSLTDSVLAVVVATGFYTEKGGLIQKMVEPESKSFAFFDDAFESLLLLLSLSCTSSIYFFYYRFFHIDQMNPPSLYTMLIQITTIFLIVAKPSIPQCLFAGLEFSVGRLKKDNISVMNRMNLAEAAWVDTVCFDKTGTLTRDNMKMFGFLTTKQEIEPFKANEKEQKVILEELKVKLEKRANQVIRLKVMMQKLGHESGTVKETSDEPQVRDSKINALSDQTELSKAEALQIVQHKIKQVQIKREEEKLRDLMIDMKLKEKEKQLSEGIRKFSTFDTIRKKIDDKLLDRPNKSLFLECFGLCNSLVKIGKKMIGDPLEVEMFRYSPFNMKFVVESKLTPSTTKVHRKDENLVKYYVPDERASNLKNRLYRQCKVFDFSNKTRRMTVVVAKYLDGKQIQQEFHQNHKVEIKGLEDLNYITVLSKGAPETIGMLCKAETLPDDYSQRDNQLSSQGLKVLALAGKRIKLKSFLQNEELWEDKEKGIIRSEFNLDQLKALEHALYERDQEINEMVSNDARQVIEDSMDFLSLYMMENPLQENAVGIIRNLKSQNILSKIITGDNLFTAMNVAMNVRILGKDSPVYVADNHQDKDDTVKWILLDQFFDEEDSDDNQEKDIYKINEIKNEFIDIMDEELNGDFDYEDNNQIETDIKNFQLGKIDVEPELYTDKQKEEQDHEIVYEDFEKEKKEQDLKIKNKVKNRSVSGGSQSELNMSNLTYEENLAKQSLHFHEVEPNLVMTGNAFDKIMLNVLKMPDINILNEFNMFSNYLKHYSLSSKDKSDMYYFAYSTKVFGRCSSLQKTRVINFLKYFKVEKNRTLAFVGDGNNDLQAIKSADFAVKLGHSELSGATSFVSDDSDLSSLLVLINEAKCTLSNGYHNFSMVIFFVIIEFVCFYILIMMGLNNNLSQILFMDFGICNLFGFCLPAIGPRRRLNIHTPAKKLWHPELAIYLIGQLISAMVLMYYSYSFLQQCDFYIPYKEIISQEEYQSGAIDVEKTKFIESHFLFVITCIYSVIFCAVDNTMDSYRKGFFNTTNRTIAFVLFFGFTMLMTILPIMPVFGNNFFMLVAYQFRIPMLFSNFHVVVSLISLTWSIFAFTFFSIIIKFISLFFGNESNSKTKILQQYEDKFLALCKE